MSFRYLRGYFKNSFCFIFSSSDRPQLTNFTSPNVVKMREERASRRLVEVDLDTGRRPEEELGGDQGESRQQRDETKVELGRDHGARRDLADGGDADQAQDSPG